ncbi:MerR family transcriptional regulator [Jiangella gansuensis]|uniref:MerR family transcriptional regulator n=1 Tax=Jiangella gansuensis TaxID=281473 RepID=UPI0004ACF786|nr:MerR family transcriptional regulator [Jiangella gansuensis]
MRIGDLAKRAGTTTALRFYEAEGLLAARRSANGYREYGEDDVRVVEEILTLQRIGFSLDETRPFVDCLRAGNPSGDACAPSSNASGTLFGVSRYMEPGRGLPSTPYNGYPIRTRMDIHVELSRFHGHSGQ